MVSIGLQFKPLYSISESKDLKSKYQILCIENFLPSAVGEVEKDTEMRIDDGENFVLGFRWPSYLINVLMLRKRIILDGADKIAD